MKIIYVENVRVPSERAHAYQIVQTCAWLARMGHDVTLVNPERAGGEDVFTWYGLPAGLFTHLRLRAWDPLSSSFPLKALAYALQRWAFTRALRTWARDAQADAWITRDAAMIDALRGIVNGPWMLESHDTPDADPARWQRIKGRVTGHIAISHGMAERLQQLGVPADRILVAADGYEPEEFRSLPSRVEARRALGISDDAFVALYSGSFYPWKGLDAVVSAWDRTPPSFHLVLVGGPSRDRARIESLIPSAARARIRLLPTRPRTEAIALYPAADVALLTSSPEHAIAREYTSPLKQFEYLAAGLPILASDVPSSHDVLTEAVARFYPSTTDGFISTLEETQRDANWRVSAASAGPELVRDYSWEARTRRVGDWMKTRISA